jgi:hypothetical protein
LENAFRDSPHSGGAALCKEPLEESSLKERPPIIRPGRENWVPADFRIIRLPTGTELGRLLAFHITILEEQQR